MTEKQNIENLDKLEGLFTYCIYKSFSYAVYRFEDNCDGNIIVTGNIENIEQERESQTTQVTLPMFAATNLYDIFMEDSVRKQYTKQQHKRYKFFHINALLVFLKHIILIYWQSSMLFLHNIAKNMAFLTFFK